MERPKAICVVLPLNSTPTTPSQNTEAEIARQDSGHESPGLDRNLQHPHHAEASATAMERPPGMNGRRVTSQTTFLQRCPYGCSPAVRSKTTLQGHFEEIAEATANQPGDKGGPRPGWTGMEKIREDWFSNL
ncbi:unnamed protein product [Schistocephalus solidus]|uniref:Uncharacterized protein n=1 Tax=Schistocephalus solidus TaxID=70667 RepID=A0A183TGD6_SCHSO|nr:unnamed protein product [Schistocephalus solidus]